MPYPFIFGLDLGKKTDFSALCAIEQRPMPGDPDRALYLLHAIEQLEHGLAYPLQVEHVRKRLVSSGQKNASLVVDETGVGSAVVDMFWLANLPATMYPIHITAGKTVSKNDDERTWNVPKRELVSVMMVLLESRRFKMAAGLKWQVRLQEQLQTFTSKQSPAGHESWSAERERDHDDLVLSVALACWAAEHFPLGWDGTIGLPSGKAQQNIIASAPPGVFAEQVPTNDPYTDPFPEDRDDGFGSSFLGGRW